MKLYFLDTLYARPGPFASVYVDTSRDTDSKDKDPDKAIELRRRHARAHLVELGADPATADAVADAIGSTGTGLPSRHGQALFATQGELLLTEELPEPPPVDKINYALLPDAMPLTLQHAPDIPYAAAVLTRGTPEDIDPAPGDVQIALQTGRWPSSSVAPRRVTCLRMPIHQWPLEAERLAGELTHLMDLGHADTLVLCGDSWARGVLAGRLPAPVRRRVTTVPGNGRGTETGRALLEPQLAALFRGRVSAHDRDRLDSFAAQRARRTHAGCEGLPATVAALQRGQADALVVNHPTDDWPEIWLGTAPDEIALSSAGLHTFGATGHEKQPADAALLSAAVCSGAELIVVSREETPLEDGIGVLVRC
ncbi:baeRF2 domain-containing protein [Streptomyces sp. NPDC002577]